mgnify:CR=1 FL=1
MKSTSSAPRKKASASSKQEWVPQPHQQKALNLLTSVANGGLFLDPGMGKTSIVLEAFKRFKAEGQVDKLVVLAPLRVASVAWPGELAKWSNFQDLTSTLVWGPKKDRRLEDDVDIYLINHEFLNTRSVTSLPPLLEKHRCMLVVDESTAFKNPSSKRFKTLRLLLPCFVRRYILTGTPIPNGVEGLWSQCFIIDEGGMLGSKLMKFRNTYMRPVFRPGVPVTLWEAAPGAVEKISDLVSPVVLQLKGEDYLKLPDYIFNEIAVDIPRKEYDLLEKELLLHLQSQTVASPNVASNIIRLRQVANIVLAEAEGPERVIRRREDRRLALAGQPLEHGRVGCQHGGDQGVEGARKRARRVHCDRHVDDVVGGCGLLRGGLRRGGEAEGQGQVSTH